MVSSEEFSFPKISNPLPHFAISPSLWRITSTVYPDFSQEEEEKIEPEKNLTRKSFSCRFETVHGGDRSHERRRMSTDEEKMDMLWEDFNEEVQRVSAMDSKKLKHYSQPEKSSPECCRNTMKKKKKRRVVYRRKRYSSRFDVVAKVLKKLFLVKTIEEGR